MEINIGDTVKVRDIGCIYTTYTYLAEELGCKTSSKFMQEFAREFESDDKCLATPFTVVNTNDDVFNDRVIALIEDSEGHQFVIDVDGITLTQKGDFVDRRIENLKTELFDAIVNDKIEVEADLTDDDCRAIVTWMLKNI